MGLLKQAKDVKDEAVVPDVEDWSMGVEGRGADTLAGIVPHDPPSPPP